MKILDEFQKEGLSMARLLSASKSAYRERFPDHIVCFNANIFSLKEGKIWYGDLDLTLEEDKLDRIAENLGDRLFVLREMDGRFGNEDISETQILQKAIYSTK